MFNMNYVPGGVINATTDIDLVVNTEINDVHFKLNGCTFTKNMSSNKDTAIVSVTSGKPSNISIENNTTFTYNSSYNSAS
jgi:hypothetical protein